MIDIWGSKQGLVRGKDGQVESSLIIKSCECYVKTDSGSVNYKETNKTKMYGSSKKTYGRLHTQRFWIIRSELRVM